jgi:dTDP-4-amino-4,6-dideoxygalactose transaminase
MAPLPKWIDLYSLLLTAALSDAELAAPWLRSDDEAFWFSRSAWSLAVVARWRRQLGHTGNLIVWIPDFFCNASLAPLRDMGVQLAFYPVNDQLEPDHNASLALASTQPPDIFVLVHYFGKPTPTAWVAAFCKEHGAWLIEDATHVLQPVPGVGEAGDCVLYSPHKHLAIPDGAVLIVRASGPTELAAKKRKMIALREICIAVVDSHGTSNRQAVLWLCKRILQRLGFRARRSTSNFLAMTEPAISAIANPGMSSVARRLLSRLMGNLDDIARSREQNARDWRNAMLLANTVRPANLSFDLPTPYLGTFVCQQGADAEALFNCLQHTGLPVTTWPDLPPEVMEHRGEHQAAIALRHNRFYLPVHQSIDQQQIIACGKSLLDMATIHWKVSVLTCDEWEEYFQYCPKANLLQSWQYGAAKKGAGGWKAIRFLIRNEFDKPVALAQVLIKEFPFIGGIARLNRGPLLVTAMFGDSEAQVKLAALGVLLREARHRRWRVLFVAPELPGSDVVRQGIQGLGLHQKTGAAWASGLIDLSRSEDELFGKLNRRWKRALRKASELGVTVKQEELTSSRLDELLKSYLNLQQRNEFRGISADLIIELSKFHSSAWSCILFVAEIINEAGSQEPVGYRLCIQHGDTATDFIVSTNEKGRQMEANYALYWQAILHARNSGCGWFDIGGLGSTTPKGIAEFKQGLNSMPYELVGEYWTV